MAYKIMESVEAESDIDEILRYLAVTLSSPDAASHFADALEKTYDQMAEFPCSFELSRVFALGQRGYRKAVIGNYVLLYRVDDNKKTVTISRLFYGKQDYEKYL